MIDVIIFVARAMVAALLASGAMSMNAQLLNPDYQGYRKRISISAWVCLALAFMVAAL